MSIVDVAKKKARQRNYDKQIGTNDWCDVCDGGDCWIVYLEMISCHTHQIKTEKKQNKKLGQSIARPLPIRIGILEKFIDII